MRNMDALRCAGRRFSVFGDSLSTLEGYNPPGYEVYYTGQICEATGVKSPSDTWWGKVIESLGAELLVNDSFSGSRVSRLPGGEKLFPSGCSDERTGALHKGGVFPDVILVFLGMNDWGNGVCCRERGTPKDAFDSFEGAYRTMLRKLRKNYPQAEICCCTLCQAYMPSDHTYVFPCRIAGRHIEDYNDVIREICADASPDCPGGCLCLLDLSSYYSPYASIEGFHPTRRGMQTLADLVIKELARREKTE